MNYIAKENFYGRCELTKSIELTALHTSHITNMKSGQSSYGEFHNFWELVLVLEGVLTATTEKEVFNINQNCMILHPPMVYHRHANTSVKNLKFIVLSFDADSIPITSNSIYILTSEDVQELKYITYLIEEKFVKNTLNLIRPKDESSHICQEIKSRLELFLVNVISGQTIPRKNINSDYKRIVKYLKDNLNRSLTLDEIAQDLNMSASNIKRIFSKYSDIGVMNYFHHCRVKYSITLLEQDYSVKEVSEILGYSSQSVFCTTFKNIMGFPPSQIKKM